MNIKKFNSAFTIIEIILVLAVVGTLYGGVSASYKTYKDEATSQQETVYAESVQMAVNNYYTKYGRYPCDIQPSKEVVLPNGDKATGYSMVNFTFLTDPSEGFLQTEPKLSGNRQYAVDYNGNVVIVKDVMPSLVIEGGQPVTAKDTVSVTVKIYDVANAATVTILQAGGGVVSDVVSPLPAEQNVSAATLAANNGVINFTNNVHLGNSTFGMKTISARVDQNGKTYTISSSVNLVSDSLNDTEAPVLNPPLNADYNEQDRAITLTWQEATDNVGVAGYNIYRTSDKNAIFPEEPYSTTTKNTFVDKFKLIPGTYYYAVEAFDAAGNKSARIQVSSPGIIISNITDNPAIIINHTKNVYNCADVEFVSATIIDPDGLAGAYVMYKQDDSDTWNLAVMYQDAFAVKDNMWKAMVPVNKYTYYYIVAEDQYKNTTTDPIDAVPMNKTLPPQNYYTLLSPLVEIFKDEYNDSSNIDTDVSNFHIYNGKITLP